MTAATLAQGLPATARVVKKLTGGKAVDNQTTLLAVIADRVGHIAWMFSEDGQAGKNHPPSLLQALTGTANQDPGFETGEEFFAAWTAITGGNNDA